MLQRLCHGDAFPRVDAEHARQQVQALGRGARELLGEGHHGLARQFTHQSERLFGGDKVQVLFRQLAELRGDDGEL